MNQENSSSLARLPLVPVPVDIQEKIKILGGNPDLNLYSILANHSKLLTAWIDFAYTIRLDCKISREIRELMILRGAQICQSDYEWFQHEKMAKQCGIDQKKIDAIRDWPNSMIFDERERLALKLMESLIENGGEIDDQLYTAIKQQFTNEEILELIMTGSFYTMVPRVLKSLRVPIET